MGFMDEIFNQRKPPFFTQLRNNDWNPRFHWEASLHGAADAINRPHEDYPARIPATKAAILDFAANLRHQPAITLDMLRAAHRTVFPDHGDAAGQWRNINVQVSNHLPPR